MPPPLARSSLHSCAVVPHVFPIEVLQWLHLVCGCLLYDGPHSQVNTCYKFQQREGAFGLKALHTTSGGEWIESPPPSASSDDGQG